MKDVETTVKLDKIENAIISLQIEVKNLLSFMKTKLEDMDARITNLEKFSDTILKYEKI